MIARGLLALVLLVALFGCERSGRTTDPTPTTTTPPGVAVAPDRAKLLGPAATILGVRGVYFELSGLSSRGPSSARVVFDPEAATIVYRPFDEISERTVTLPPDQATGLWARAKSVLAGPRPTAHDVSDYTQDFAIADGAAGFYLTSNGPFHDGVAKTLADELLALGQAIPAAPAVAACVRSPLVPSELPHVGCPTEVTRTNDPKAQTVVLRLRYDGNSALVANEWGDALVAKGWNVTITGFTVTATFGHDKVTVDPVEDHTTKATIVTLTFVPA